MSATDNDVTGQNTTASASETLSTEQNNLSGSGFFDRQAHRRNLETAQQALIDEFHTLIADTERLLKFTQDNAGSQAQELRSRVNANLERARSMLQEREGNVRSQCEQAIRCTEDYVHNRPWQSIGIAAGVGFLLGLITRR